MNETTDPLARVKAIYPPDDEFFCSPSDYGPLIRSFGEVILEVSDEDYTGDSRFILKRGEEYGLLIFGWGSCSGCDALKACDSYEAIEKLRAKLESDVKWMSAGDLLNYVKTHDWDGDFSGYNDEATKRFLEKAKAILEGLT